MASADVTVEGHLKSENKPESLRTNPRSRMVNVGRRLRAIRAPSPFCLMRPRSGWRKQNSSSINSAMSLPLHLPLKEGRLFRGRPKIRLSLMPILASIAIPWAFFAFTYIALASSVHFVAPWQTAAAVAGGALVLLCFFFAWLDQRTRGVDPKQMASLQLWAFYFLVAWTLGVAAGSMSYAAQPGCE
ncbi:hypothetical protein AK812_SmicGene44501 [Symbiodinium microadriaticum]|uniref:Uncharacterized protein n=1 Tax=Symbiodinium microadriaticum TaxID=2951 RepID=A0A1Q9BYB0_SYMMI|nr:hypothetical protein AK812_SmicGene44501 [Symbiodinium microadriaticum]